jgi:hypothetical protein
MALVALIKSESRIPKSETISNYRNSNCLSKAAMLCGIFQAALNIGTSQFQICPSTPLRAESLSNGPSNGRPNRFEFRVSHFGFVEEVGLGILLVESQWK